MFHTGDASYVPAAQVLASFLDFRVSSAKTARQSPLQYRNRMPWLGKEYPAATALFEIGLAASGSLVAAIGDSASLEIVRDHAAEVLLVLHRDHPANAVMVPITAGKVAPDAETANRLRESAAILARKCGPQSRSACEAALN